MTLPKTMTAIEITRPGAPEVLQPTTRPIPEPQTGEVLIKVRAAGVNRPDVLQRLGVYPPPPGASDIPGLEVAGEIVKLGASVTGWSTGQTCMALVAGGGYAEYCTSPAVQCLPIPQNLDMTLAAAIPETFFTVWTNVFERARLKAGESFLVHGGASGIGTTAIQLAKAFGARVFATAGSADRCRACETLGADKAIDYKNQDFVTEIKALTTQDGVDVILDMVGGTYFPRNIDLLKTEGRLVQIALLGGAQSEINLQKIMVKRLTVTGSTLRARPAAEKGEIAKALQTQVLPLLERGTVKPVIDQIFSLTEAAAAHRQIDAAHVGKIVLTV